MNQKSKAVILREQGNETKKEADSLSKKLNPKEDGSYKEPAKFQEAVEKYKKAADLYLESTEEAQNEEEACSAFKNLGIAYKKIFELTKEQSYSDLAKNSFLEAIKEGSSTQKESYLDELYGQFSKMLPNAETEKIPILLAYYQKKEQFLSSYPTFIHKLLADLALCFMKLASDKRIEILAPQKNSESPGAAFMKKQMCQFEAFFSDARRYLVELENLNPKYIGLIHFRNGLASEKLGLSFIKCLYESEVLKEKGEGYEALDALYSYLENSKDGSLDEKMYIARVNYEIALCLIQIDEAQNEDKIYEHVQNTCQVLLSTSVNPNCHWLKHARTILEGIQFKRKKREEEQKENEKSLTDEVKMQLKSIEELMKTNPQEMVKKIYFLFPNSTGSETEKCPNDTDLLTKNLESTLLNKVIPVYHPDRNKSGKYNKEIYRRITQAVNNVVSYNQNCRNL